MTKKPVDQPFPRARAELHCSEPYRRLTRANRGIFDKLEPNADLEVRFCS